MDSLTIGGRQTFRDARNRSAARAAALIPIAIFPIDRPGENQYKSGMVAIVGSQPPCSHSGP
jgi:hypothetical protein